MKLNIPDTYHVNVRGKDVTVSTLGWDHYFVEVAVERAIKEFLRKRSATLSGAITSLEAGSWFMLPAPPLEKAKRLIAKLSPEQRATLLEALNERHEKESCQ